MHNACEWQMHLYWMQCDEASLILLQTILLRPIMSDAQSEAKPMPLLSVWSIVITSAFIRSKITEPVTCSALKVLAPWILQQF